MKKTTKKKILFLCLFLFVAICVLVISITFDNKEPVIGFQSKSAYDETLLVAADKDFDPYSFYDELGNPSGHDIEMIYLLAEAMKMNVEIRLMEWNEAVKATKNKEVDVLLGLVYTPNGLEKLQLSIPICNDAFLVFSKKDYSGLNDLYSKKIAILKGSDIKSLFIDPYRLEKRVTEYGTYGEAFESVENGQNDCVIATYSIGRRFSAQYKDIRPFGSALMSNAFCLAVAAEKSDLIKNINKIIIEKRSDGTLGALSEKWLGKYVEIIGIGDFFKHHSLLLAGLVSFAFFVPLLSLIYVYRRRSISLKENESMLLDRASRDSLTLLLNRKAAERAISQSLSVSQVETRHALCMIDIDNFKMINDTQGHLFGDHVLATIAQDIKNAFREHDIVARMGGDEFMVFIKNVKKIEAIEESIGRVCASLCKTIRIKGTNIRVSVSIGVSFFPRDGCEFKKLYNNADEALYMAKERGKNQFVIYPGS